MHQPLAGGGQQPPEDVRDVDQLLRRLRFQPRSSLGPELLGRMGRREPPQLPSRSTVLYRFGAVVLALGVSIALVLLALGLERSVQIDRCCYDLDGGGSADDGALIIAERDGRVHRLSVYEDRDASGNFTAGDTLRLVRTGAPILETSLPAGSTSIRHCCQDLDGGGPPDDGLLVIASPPDRVHTAAIYELR